MSRKFAHIDTLSETLDSQDVDKVLEYLTEDCLFTAGNSESIQGKKDIKSTLNSFFDSVKSTRHRLSDIFESDNSLVHRGDVTYTRLDNTKLTVPFCDVFKIRDNKIAEYTIYIDWSELFN